MAKLTKQQQAELDTLREERDIARALAWPNFPCPQPMQRPTGDETIHGWTFNVYSRELREQWQTSGCSYDSPKEINGSHGCPPLYATEREAWQALYHACCRECGKTLAKVLKKANGEQPL